MIQFARRAPRHRGARKWGGAWLFLATALANPCFAQEGKKIAPLDLLVDFRSLVGQVVVSGPCLLQNASTHFVNCGVAQNGQHVGSIMLKPENMDRESFRRALRDCAGFRTQAAKCAAYVTGRVSINPLNQVAIEGASLRFRD